MLTADTTISVGAHAQVVLSFSDNSVAVVEQLSVLTIAAVYERHAARAEKPTVVTRLKLVNGSVRAGVERGRTDSDFRISTPVATLSVRGTRPIRIFYDAGTGQLWFYLGREGVITGQLVAGGRTIDIYPGEGTNQWLILPVLLAIFDQHVVLGHPWGQTLQEYVVEVTHSNAVGGFGGGNPQTFQQVSHTTTGGSNTPGRDGASGGRWAAVAAAAAPATTPSTPTTTAPPRPP